MADPPGYQPAAAIQANTLGVEWQWLWFLGRVNLLKLCIRAVEDAEEEEEEEEEEEDVQWWSNASQCL